MHRDDPLDELFEDLEQQAAGLHLADRDAEVADRGAAEYAAVDLAGRLHASLGRQVAVKVAGAGFLDGTLRRVGAGWFLLESPGGEHVVSTGAVEQLSGLSPQTVSEPLRGVDARLTLRSVLRNLADARSPVGIRLHSGEQLTTRVLRVGADFVEAVRDDIEGSTTPVVVPLGRIATLHLR